MREIRIRSSGRAYRIIYTAKIGNAVYVLPAFQKKTRKTVQGDIELARMRLKEIGGQP